MAKSDLIFAHNNVMEASDSESSLKIITANEFIHTIPPKKEFLLKNTLPLGITGLVVGQSGIGKSFLTLDLAMSIASDVPVCGGLYEVESPGGVLIVQVEDGMDTIHERLFAITKYHKELATGQPDFSVNSINHSKIVKGAISLHIVDIQISVPHS